MSFLVTPIANLNIFISATSISSTCFFVTATVSSPYTIAGLTTELYTFPFTLASKLLSQITLDTLFHPFHRTCRRRRRLKGIHSRPDTNRTGAEGLSFYYPRLLHCLDQMLAVMLLSQHRVSSSKTVRPRASCGARCMGHAVSTWSAVCSEAPHSKFGEGARPHLCMDEWNCPTPIRRRLSLTQAARGKPIPTGPGHKSTELGSTFTVLRVPFVICPFRGADAKSGKIVQKIPRTWHKRASGS